LSFLKLREQPFGPILPILMQGPYPKQDVGAREVTKSGTNVQECRISVIFGAFDRLRVVLRKVARTKIAQPSVLNALGWRDSVTG
jgi:hypothetical protein